MLFFLWGMLAWLKFRKTQSTKDYIFAFLLVLIAMLAKTAIVMVPLLMRLHIWWEVGWSKRLDWNQTMDFFGTLLLFVLWCAFGYEFQAVGAGLPGIVCFFVFLVTPGLFIFHHKNPIYDRLAPVWRQVLPFFALSFILGIVTVIFQNTRAIGAEHIPIGGFEERVAGASFAARLLHL